jgi:2-oxoglutarate/2-oxoacid ferredoxin oxidoreductase subunit alpha
VPKPVQHKASEPTRFGAIHYGSTSPAMMEALDRLEENDVHLDTLRVRAFPFQHEVAEFIDSHDQVFVVEQNRDAQLRTLLVTECDIDPAKLIPVLHYDGTPITARFIAREIGEGLSALNVKPIKRTA